MASLYEIDSNIKSILDSVLDQTDENGEFTGDIESIYASLEELQEAREAKMENIALYAKNLTAEALAIKNEENILADRRKRLERKCERLEGILMQSILINGGTKASSARYEASVRYYDETKIIDETKIPEEFIKVKTTKSPDKVAIKTAIKAGQAVEGAEIESVPHIKIK
jgi:DNA mismatch repair ATPase MutS